jgi:hypothetical protein
MVTGLIRGGKGVVVPFYKDIPPLPPASGVVAAPLVVGIIFFTGPFVINLYAQSAQGGNFPAAVLDSLTTLGLTAAVMLAMTLVFWYGSGWGVRKRHLTAARPGIVTFPILGTGALEERLNAISGTSRLSSPVIPNDERLTLAADRNGFELWRGRRHPELVWTIPWQWITEIDAASFIARRIRVNGVNVVVKTQAGDIGLPLSMMGGGLLGVTSCTKASAFSAAESLRTLAGRARSNA